MKTFTKIFGTLVTFSDYSLINFQVIYPTLNITSYYRYFLFKFMCDEWKSDYSQLRTVITNNCIT